MARNNTSSNRMPAALLLAGVFAVLLLGGCPSKHGGGGLKINVDSVLKANKALTDSAIKLSPLFAPSIPMDSLKTLLRVAPSVSDKMLRDWFYTPKLLLIEPVQAPECPLVVVHFTDMEVSELFNRVSAEYPSELYRLVGQIAPPVFSAQPFFLSPNVFSYSCNPASTADWVPYDLTSAQQITWSATSMSVKNDFISALNAFRFAAGTPGTQNVLWITNLRYGSPSTAPYSGVMYTVTNYNASTRIHVIQLIDT